jgi:hypothetical protein
MSWFRTGDLPGGLVRRTLVKRNVKTGALAFDSGVLTKMLEKRGVAPPLSEAAAAAWDENTGGQLLPADALEYLQVLGHCTPPSPTYYAACRLHIS